MSASEGQKNVPVELSSAFLFESNKEKEKENDPLLVIVFELFASVLFLVFQCEQNGISYDHLDSQLFDISRIELAHGNIPSNCTPKTFAVFPALKELIILSQPITDMRFNLLV
jgi:hypothetical protein